MEEQMWAEWGYIYHRWGTLPYKGGAMEQPWIFWFMFNLITQAIQKKEKEDKYNKDIKRVDFKLEY